MKYMTGFGRRGCFDLKPAHCALLLSVAAAGCSADVTRFDSASFSLNDPPQTTASVQTERSPTEVTNPVTRSRKQGPYSAGLGSTSGIDSAPLPDVAGAPAAQLPVTPVAAPSSITTGPVPTAASTTPPRAKPLYRPATQQIALAAQPAPMPEAGKGEVIEVQPGDTLYRLSRKHQVSLNELMSVNGLKSPDLKPGQKLYLPSSTGARMVAATPSAVAPLAAAPSVTAPQAAAAAPPAAMAAASPDVAAKYSATYTVQPGDSLYGIARKHKVPFNELQTVNGIVNPLKVRPGVVLKVPGGTGVAVAAASPSVPATTAALIPATPAPAAEPAATPSVPSTSTQPTVINAAKPAETAVPVPPTSAETSGKGDKVAIATPPAKPAVTEDTTKLRWPAQGKIISGFGGRPDGTHNDGINLSVPQGTDVHAAESGVIAYAGSELKGYGNLVLVRHDNGWVTAYAHNDELLVKRGDKVARGQVIAKAGKTGTVDQPQIHFELRQGSKPVDPTPFMEKL